jgi:CIC family chloride channel protein
VRVCQVFEQLPTGGDLTQLRSVVSDLETQLRCPVKSCPAWGNPVPDTVLQLAAQQDCDVIMLGASREGLLRQVIKGNIPEAITRDSPCSVILVRGAITTGSDP